MTVKAAYIIREGAEDYLCVLVREGEFHKFPISQITQARLASECATSVWSGLCRGLNGATPDA